MAKRSESEIDVQIDGEFEVSSDELRRVAQAVLDHEGQEGQLSLVLTNDQALRDLNHRYLGIDAPTDVLAFAAREERGDFVTAPEAHIYLGDVIVSYSRAVIQAGERNLPVQNELYLLIVHGILHLLGYDHAQEADKEAMWQRQDEILQELLAGPL